MRTMIFEIQQNSHREYLFTNHVADILIIK